MHASECDGLHLTLQAAKLAQAGLHFAACSAHHMDACTVKNDSHLHLSVQNCFPTWQLFSFIDCWSERVIKSVSGFTAGAPQKDSNTKPTSDGNTKQPSQDSTEPPSDDNTKPSSDSNTKPATSAPQEQPER